MRKIYDPTSGADVTATVQSYLQAGNAPVTCYLYSFRCMNFWDYNPYGHYATFCYTDFEAPLFVTYAQTGPGPAGFLTTSGGAGQAQWNTGLEFLAENIGHDKLSYGIGFEDRPVEVNWAMEPTRNYGALFSSLGNLIWDYPSVAAYPANFTLRQALTMGLFTEAPFWIHECIFTDFPRLGGSFLGTTLMFRGFIRKTTSTQSTLKISLASLMDVFQSVQVPTQTITPNNRTLPYIPLAVSPYNDGGLFTHYSSFSFPNPTTLQCTTTYSIPTNALQDSWINFAPAAYIGGVPYHNGWPTVPSWRIQGNTAGPGTIQIYFYEPYVFPNNPGGFNIWAQQATGGGPAAGFLHLPPPEFTA